MDITWSDSGSGLDAARKSLPDVRPEPEWCERCHCYHQGQSKADWDAIRSKQVKQLADAIDADILNRILSGGILSNGIL